MARREVKHETQRSVSDWGDAALPAKTPDQIMHEFLDMVKDLEVAWFTSDVLDEVAENMAKVQMFLFRCASEIKVNLQQELDTLMDRKRRGL